MASRMRHVAYVPAHPQVLDPIPVPLPFPPTLFIAGQQLTMTMPQVICMRYYKNEQGQIDAAVALTQYGVN